MVGQMLYSFVFYASQIILPKPTISSVGCHKLTYFFPGYLPTFEVQQKPVAQAGNPELILRRILMNERIQKEENESNKRNDITQLKKQHETGKVKPTSPYQTKEGQKPPIQTREGKLAGLWGETAQNQAVQRKESNDLKSIMGNQYGVDLSGYRETQNSSFPAKVGALATIQGKDIHYAPGQYTEKNRKHELGHAIDNTLNGTPKGDTTVQGHNIDTTREAAADKIADAPLQRNVGSNWELNAVKSGVEQTTTQASKPSGHNVVQRTETWGEWAQRHKTKIVVGGLSVLTLAGLYYYKKNGGKIPSGATTDTLVKIGNEAVKPSMPPTHDLMDEVVYQAMRQAKNVSDLADHLGKPGVPPAVDPFS